MIEDVIERGHRHVRDELPGGVDELLADESRIVEFRLMIGPLHAVDIAHEHMRAALEALK